jgi:hypothetical protein
LCYHILGGLYASEVEGAETFHGNSRTCPGEVTEQKAKHDQETAPRLRGHQGKRACAAQSTKEKESMMAKGKSAPKPTGSLAKGGKGSKKGLIHTSSNLKMCKGK